jgi:hypothetical protein
LGEKVNNPDTTWAGRAFRMHPYSRHEDRAGNPIHMVMALCAMVLVFKWAREGEPERRWYALSLFLAVLFYCLALKWQPWASRLHTPLFLLSAPAVALAFTANTRGFGMWVYYSLIVCMMLYCIPFAVNNESRSLISLDWLEKKRTELYFQNRPNLYASYKEAIKFLQNANANDIGLYLGEDDWEYPFWALAKAGGESNTSIRFRHVGVSNSSKTLSKAALLPAYVISTKDIAHWEDKGKYSPVFSSKYTAVLKKIEPEKGMHTGQDIAPVSPAVPGG